MATWILIVLTLLGAWAAWGWFVARNRPALPPLEIDEADPLMIEARAQARAAIPKMLELYQAAPDSTRVKVPFVTSTGVTEYLWAELLSVAGSSINVRYLTPPVTHTGKLERLHTHALDDIVDWVVTQDRDKYVGGYSMRVMFRRGREQWGDLPPALKAEEAKYI